MIWICFLKIKQLQNRFHFSSDSLRGTCAPTTPNPNRQPPANPQRSGNARNMLIHLADGDPQPLATIGSRKRKRNPLRAAVDESERHLCPDASFLGGRTYMTFACGGKGGVSPLAIALTMLHPRHCAWSSCPRTVSSNTHAHSATESTQSAACSQLSVHLFSYKKSSSAGMLSRLDNNKTRTQYTNKR